MTAAPNLWLPCMLHGVLRVCGCVQPMLSSCAAVHAPQGAPVAPGAKLPLLGDESIMKPKAHGTTDKPVQVCAWCMVCMGQNADSWGHRCREIE